MQLAASCPKFHDHQHIEVILLRTRYTSRLNPENNGGTRNVPQPRLSRDLLALSLSVPAAAESAHHQSQTWHHHHRVGRQTDRRPSARSSELVFVGARHAAGSILRRFYHWHVHRPAPVTGQNEPPPANTASRRNGPGTVTEAPTLSSTDTSFCNSGVYHVYD